MGLTQPIVSIVIIDKNVGVFFRKMHLQDTKISLCFSNREIKTHLFLGITVKNDFNMRISFLLKQFCCCCFDTRLVFLIGVSSSPNSIQLYIYIYFILCIYILKIVLQFYLKPATLLKKRLWHRYFPVSFTKFLRTPIVFTWNINFFKSFF